MKAAFAGIGRVDRPCSSARPCGSARSLLRSAKSSEPEIACLRLAKHAGSAAPLLLLPANPYLSLYLPCPTDSLLRPHTPSVRLRRRRPPPLAARPRMTRTGPSATTSTISTSSTRPRRPSACSTSRRRSPRSPRQSGTTTASTAGTLRPRSPGSVRPDARILIAAGRLLTGLGHDYASAALDFHQRVRLINHIRKEVSNEAVTVMRSNGSLTASRSI